MVTELALATSNSALQSCTSSSIIHVEIITLALYYGYDIGALFYVQPAYEEALADISLLYPCLHIRQNIVYDRSQAYKECLDLMPDSDFILSRYYYSKLKRWGEANFTIFVHSRAGQYESPVIISVWSSYGLSTLPGHVTSRFN